MTIDELNAVIDKELYSNQWVCCKRVRINGLWIERETWLLSNLSPHDPPAGTFAGQRPPNHAAIVKWFRANPPPQGR